MPRPRTHDEALRVRLLDRAGELISADGAGALSLRRLAADVQTSTTAVYSLFGSKPELVNALYVEGFRRFRDRLADVELTGDAAEDLVRLGLAYRQSALADPNLYSIMFTKAVPGFEASADADELATSTMTPLLDVVRAGMASGRFVEAPPEMIAIGAWGTVHGLVSLELNGNLPDGFDVGAVFEALLRGQVQGLLR